VSLSIFNVVLIDFFPELGFVLIAENPDFLIKIDSGGLSAENPSFKLKK
jgi:hypothetical protein